MSEEQEDLTLSNMYRMPIAFGPSPGPRNLPKGKRHLRYHGESLNFSIMARTESAALERLLPTEMRLAEASFTVGVMQLRNVGWLAGRGYNIVSVMIPVKFEGRKAPAHGNFLAVMWESMADPILTGREELGFPKLFANISSPAFVDGAYSTSADWEGFRFFEMSVADLKEDTRAMAPPQRLFVHKYSPRTGEWGKADAAYFTSGAGATHDTTPPRVEIRNRRIGIGKFQFFPARWEDMPTQYPIVSALAALPIHEFQCASVAERSGQDDLLGQHIVD